jgi:DNA-binding LytR/AlgR family response regulator
MTWARTGEERASAGPGPPGTTPLQTTARGASSAQSASAASDAARGGGAVALVVDDEAPALDELTYLLRSMPAISAVHVAASSSDALRSLQERRYDIVFLDIRMPSLNGIELANVLGRFATPPAIVFVTAYEEYAVSAFDIGACDYLLKPVSSARLRTALSRALGRPGDTAMDGGLGRSEVGRPPGDDGSPGAIPVEAAGRLRLITPGQVCWVEAVGDYVRLHMTKGDAHLLRMPISHLEEKWAAHGFIRIHRGYLVSVGKITEFSVSGSNHSVKVSGRSLPVSRRHARDVRDRVLRAGRRQ